jgi:hypothetical protein
LLIYINKKIAIVKMMQDIDSQDMNILIEPRPFAVSSNSQLSYYRDGYKVFKFRGTQREIDMMLAAGDCSVRVCGRVVFPNLDGTFVTMGFTMPRETPLNVVATDPARCPTLLHGMVSRVLALHARGMVHGDVKLANMLLCSDGQVRLCDFAEARPLNEDPANWEGTVTVNYVSPHRCRTWPGSRDPPPVVEDDLYGLGLSIWELYTGKVPFDGVYEDDVREAIKAGQTVDVMEVTDLAVRGMICQYLRCGGARV